MAQRNSSPDHSLIQSRSALDSGIPFKSLPNVFIYILTERAYRSNIIFPTRAHFLKFSRDPPLGKDIDFFSRLYTRLPGFKYDLFSNFLGRGSPKPLLRPLRHSISLRLWFGHRPQFHTQQVYFLSNKEGLDQILFSSLNFRGVLPKTPYIVPRLRNTPLIKSMTSGWKNVVVYFIN